jgi:hypothetical protein
VSVFGRTHLPAPYINSTQSVHEVDAFGAGRRPLDMKMERSFSNPDAFDMLPHAPGDFSWLTEEGLIEQLQKNHVELSGPKPVRGRGKRPLQALAEEQRNRIGTPSPVLMSAYWSGKQHVAPAGSLLKEVLPLEVTSASIRWVMNVIGKRASFPFRLPLTSSCSQGSALPT